MTLRDLPRLIDVEPRTVFSLARLGMMTLKSLADALGPAESRQLVPEATLERPMIVSLIFQESDPDITLASVGRELALKLHGHTTFGIWGRTFDPTVREGYQCCCPSETLAIRLVRTSADATLVSVLCEGRESS